MVFFPTALDVEARLSLRNSKSNDPVVTFGRVGGTRLIRRLLNLRPSLFSCPRCKVRIGMFDHHVDFFWDTLIACDLFGHIGTKLLADRGTKPCTGIQQK